MSEVVWPGVLSSSRLMSIWTVRNSGHLVGVTRPGERQCAASNRAATEMRFGSCSLPGCGRPIYYLKKKQ